MTQRKRILFAHERRPIARAVERVLGAHGFAVTSVTNAEAAARALTSGEYDGLAVDVALPGTPGYELTSVARDHGVEAVILIASVYRRTSYKRRPTRLYGADDYVEVHHLGDQLPDKLRKHLGMPVAELEGALIHRVGEELRIEGDSRLGADDPERLASLVVADVILYNGDAIARAHSAAEAESALADDLRGARELFAQVQSERGQGVVGDPIGSAFRALMEHLRSEASGDGE